MSRAQATTALWALGLSLIVSSARAAQPHVYAVIVANNRSADGSLPPLHYADDDGARYFELFSLIGTQVELLSVLDGDTQRLHPEATKKARPPSERELEDALLRTFERISADKARGIPTTFYFIYAGHGSVGSDGQGEMHLVDGTFGRSQVYQRVLARSQATTNHLIIDACNAYFMVARRGGNVRASEADMDAAVKSFLDKESLARYPNTGVLVSTSKAADVHEWARFSAGIFSHEVRSGLAGAADVDRDGQVRYDEILAFLAAANGRIPDPRARLDVHAQAPAIRLDEPLFDRRPAKNAPVVLVSPEPPGHYWLEDERGVRYADFNLAADGAVELVLVPKSTYFLRNDSEEIKIPLTAMARVDVGALPREPTALALRGSEAATFQQFLFSVPFGQAFFDGYRASAPPAGAGGEVEMVLPPLEPQGLSKFRIAGLALGGAGLAAIGTGIGFGFLAGSEASDYRTGIGSSAELDEIRSDSRRDAALATVLCGVGGGLIGTGVLLWLLSD